MPIYFRSIDCIVRRGEMGGEEVPTTYAKLTLEVEEVTVVVIFFERMLCRLLDSAESHS